MTGFGELPGWGNAGTQGDAGRVVCPDEYGSSAFLSPHTLP